MRTVRSSTSALLFGVLPGLVSGIDDAADGRPVADTSRTKSWMAGTGPAMTGAANDHPPALTGKAAP
jgi:hypothetical protein